MSLNIEKKPYYIIFRSRNKELDASDEILINGCKVEQVQTTKLLNSSVSPLTAIRLGNDISKNIGIIIESHKIVNMDTLLTLCYLFIYQYLNYCFHQWGSNYASYINKVFHLQKKKKTIRIIYGANRRAHSEPLFSSLCVLSVSKMYVYNIGLVMYRYHHGLLSHISHI